ncbi:hypothetical protein SFUMM280S_05218 [Streptomyces fumanus]
MPGQRGLLQEPDGDRAAPPLVVRAALRAEQRPREAVRLLGADPGDPQQMPGVGAQRLVRALAERRDDLGASASGAPPAVSTARTAWTASGAGAGERPPTGPAPAPAAVPARAWWRGAGRGSAKTAAGGFSPLSTARTAASSSAAVPLSLAPAATGAFFSALRRSIRSRSSCCASNSASASDNSLPVPPPASPRPGTPPSAAVSPSAPVPLSTAASPPAGGSPSAGASPPAGTSPSVGTSPPAVASASVASSCPPPGASASVAPPRSPLGAPAPSVVPGVAGSGAAVASSVVWVPCSQRAPVVIGIAVHGLRHIVQGPADLVRKTKRLH